MPSDIQVVKPYSKAGLQTDPRLQHHPGIHCSMTRKAHGSEISMTVKPLAYEQIMETFSRAMEIFFRCGRRLFVSGTASIAPDGQTLWKEDVHKRVNQATKVVEAILHSRGFSFQDVTRATAHFKRQAGVQAFKKWCAATTCCSNLKQTV